MKYNEEINRELQLSESDMIDLLRWQEAEQEVDDGTITIRVNKIDFVRALGKVEASGEMSEERAKKVMQKREEGIEYPTITSEPMPAEEDEND